MADVPHISLSDFYHSQMGLPRTDFTRLFLSGPNILRVRQMLQNAVLKDTGLSEILPIEFTDQILSELMQYAQQYAQTKLEYVDNVNNIFVKELANGMVWDANQNAQYSRWQREAIPDPNNVPRPIQPDREERAIDAAEYMLSHPWGGTIPRY